MHFTRSSLAHLFRFKIIFNFESKRLLLQQRLRQVQLLSAPALFDSTQLSHWNEWGCILFFTAACANSTKVIVFKIKVHHFLCTRSFFTEKTSDAQASWSGTPLLCSLCHNAIMDLIQMKMSQMITFKVSFTTGGAIWGQMQTLTFYMAAIKENEKQAQILNMSKLCFCAKISEAMLAWSLKHVWNEFPYGTHTDTRMCHMII